MARKQMQKRVRKKAKSSNFKLFRRIPDKMYIQLKWSGTTTLSASAGLMAVARTSCNSLFDPDLDNSLGNHQPTWFDSLCANLEATTGLYHKYMVHGVRYKATFVNSDTSVEHDVGVVATPHGNTIDTSDDFDAIVTSKWARMKGVSVNASGANRAIITGYVPIRKIEGVKSLDRSAYQAINTSSPSYQPQLAFLARAMNESSAVGQCLCRVELVYDIEFFDRLYRSSTD